MTEKEFQKLGRPQLLKMMLEQTKRAEKLAEENKRLKERITERERQLTMVGSLAGLAVRMFDSGNGAAPDADTIRQMSGALHQVNDLAGQTGAENAAAEPAGESEARGAKPHV